MMTFAVLTLTFLAGPSDSPKPSLKGKPRYLQVGSVQWGFFNQPAQLTVTVTPPAPGAVYSVTCTYGSVGGHSGWFGTLPAGAVAPVASTQVCITPGHIYGEFKIKRLADGSVDPTQFYCNVTFMPGAGNADLGGGSIWHTGVSTAGPTAWIATKGYSFAVGP